MATINLPEEILQLIFSHLDCASDSDPDPSDDGDSLDDIEVNQKSLASVCRASRTFKRLALPYLYRLIHLEAYEHPKLRPLLRTLMAKPELGLKVKELRVASFSTNSDIDMGHILPSKTMPEIAINAVKTIDTLHLPWSTKSQLNTALRNGLQDAEIAVLLCLCPNLEILDIEAVYGIADTLAMQVIKDSRAQMNADKPKSEGVIPFCRLRELRTHHWGKSTNGPPLKHSLILFHRILDTECCTDLMSLSEALQLPTLRVFRGRMMHFDQAHEAPLPFPPNWSSLSEVYLTSSLLDPEGFEMLLHACPNLLVFSMHWGDGNVGHTAIDWSQLGDVLRKTRPKHLETLRLDPSDVGWYDVGVNDWRYPIGSLIPISSLKHLTIPQIGLLALEDDGSMATRSNLAEILPVGLQTLKILEIMRNTKTQLDVLLVQLAKDKRFEKLVRIELMTDEGSAIQDTSVRWTEERVDEQLVVLRKMSTDD